MGFEANWSERLWEYVIPEVPNCLIGAYGNVNNKLFLFVSLKTVLPLGSLLYFDNGSISACVVITTSVLVGIKSFEEFAFGIIIESTSFNL